MTFLIDPYRTPPAKLTSSPYPILEFTQMTVAADLVRGRIYSWDKEQITLAIELVAGELRQILKSHDMRPEGIAVAIELVSGELRQILKSYDGQPESMTVAIELVSGTLEVKLIRYLNWNKADEQIAVACDLVSGSLA